MKRREGHGWKAMPLLRIAAWVLGLVLATFTATTAQAYPQFVFKGYGDCGSCHHSPTGGGLANRWGLESLDVSFGADSGPGWGNQALTAEAANPYQLKVDLGLDIRLLPIFGSDGDGSLGPTVIPMLAEIGGAAAVGPWMFYGTITGKKLEGTGTPYVLASREHWLKYQASPKLDVRLGRMVLPFGIRQPDHTQYVREDFEFDKYDQSYGLEVDFRGAQWSLFGNVFAGDLTGRPKERQERGAVLTVSRQLGEDGAAIGLSALGSTSTARSRFAGSLFGRVPLATSAYALAEVAAQHFAAQEGDDTLATLAEYLRVGWFVRPQMDLYLEAGNRSLLNADGLTKTRAGLGLNWQVLRWFEFAPQLFAEARSNLPARVVALAQLHLIY